MRLNRSGNSGGSSLQVRPFFRLIPVVIFCIVLAGIFSLIDPLIIRLLIDDVIPNRRLRLLPLVALAFS